MSDRAEKALAKKEARVEELLEQIDKLRKTGLENEQGLLRKTAAEKQAWTNGTDERSKSLLI